MGCTQSSAARGKTTNGKDGIRRSSALKTRHSSIPPAAQFDLHSAHTAESDGDLVEEHSTEIVQRHIAKCVARAAARFNINDDLDQFTPIPPSKEEVAYSCAICRTWLDSLIAEQETDSLESTSSCVDTASFAVSLSVSLELLPEERPDNVSPQVSDDFADGHITTKTHQISADVAHHWQPIQRELA